MRVIFTRMRRFIIAIFGIYLLCNLKPLFATRVEGFVTDENNLPLPFCNVYIPNTNFACASNENGFYSLDIVPGNYQLKFQYIGFVKQEIPIIIGDKLITVNVKMVAEIMDLDEIVINSDKEDPAYAIIRQAIALREKHLKEISSFTCDAYIKGLQKLLEAPDKILGVQLNTVLDVDSNNTGIVYLSESASTFHFKYPNQSKEIMKASKVSGDNNQFSWNDAASMQMNFYKNMETLEGFSQRGFVSPIADNALFFYEYELLSNTADGNNRIYKIAVKPKRKADPAYEGTLYITDDDFRISGLQLQLTANNGIEFIDTFSVAQEFYYTDANNLVLLSNKFNFTYSFFGIKGMGFFHAFYNNYTLNPIFEKNFFNGEKTRIEENSNKQDSIYWSKARPIQLTEEEAIDYQFKDSLAIVRELPAFKDSVDKIFNRFKPAALLGGYTWRNSNKKLFLLTNPVFDLLQYNTVETYVINPKFRITKRLANKDEIFVSSDLRYGIGSDKFYANGTIGLNYNNITKAGISLSGGSEIMQYNTRGISPLVNTVYSLLLEENYLKLYEQQFISIKAGQELLNGLHIDIEPKYTVRKQLNNVGNAAAWIATDEQNFTSNNFPFYPDDIAFNIPDKFSVELQLKYAIGQTYIMEPGNKFILGNKYPTLTLNWEKAISGVAASAINYDKFKFTIADDIKLALAGNLSIVSAVGVMVNHDAINIADLMHFSGNETNVQKVDNEGFFLLPYYYASTDGKYFVSHLQWHTEGFLFRQLPGFKQLKLEPVFSFNYLSTDFVSNYIEIAAGIEHIFKIIRVDIAYTPFKFETPYPTPKMNILIGFGF